MLDNGPCCPEPNGDGASNEALALVTAVTAPRPPVPQNRTMATTPISRDMEIPEILSGYSACRIVFESLRPDGLRRGTRPARTAVVLCPSAPRWTMPG